MGTTYYHGETFPCIIQPNSDFNVDCQIFFGNGVNPSQIIVTPNQNADVGRDLSVIFPLLLNPIIDMSEVKIRILGQLFDDASLKWIDHVFFEDFIFVAKDIIIPEENRPALVCSPNNSVSELSSFSFSFVSPVELLTPSSGSFDKIMLIFDNSQFILQNETILNNMTCANFNVVVYNVQKMIELTPQVQINNGDNVTITCNNFINQ